MNHIERFYATVNREKVDYPASWLGLPVPSAWEALTEYFKIDNINEMTSVVDDDIYPIEMPYHSPTSDAIYNALCFAKEFESTLEDRTLTAAGFFENIEDPKRIDEFPWPDPEDYIDIEECKRLVGEAPKDKVLIGVVWSAHFQDACAAFGMENALMKMLLNPDMFKAVINRITEFYLKANRIFYEATEGKLHGVLIGNDLGSQTGLMLSPESIREYIFPGTKRLVEQAKAYNLVVVHHSCGSIFPIINDLIDIGVDVIHPIQALAKDMNPEKLKDAFGDKVSFCGGVDAQNLLVNGTPEMVHEKVLELKRIFPSGLILSPSHEAILPDIPPANIEALFHTVKEEAVQV